MPAFCATSIRMPESPPLTEKQIAWAKSHDWFCDIDSEGNLVIVDCYTKDGQYFEERQVWTAGFRALRDWAGY